MNTHAKYLLRTHAFEVMQCIRVEWKTDINNHKSRNAILRLGAKKDGIFRNHMILPDGSLRDSVYYSIISDEWHDTKKQLQIKL